MRWVVRGVGVLLALVLLAAEILHWVIVPRVDEWRPRLERLASQAIAAPVQIGAIEAQSNGLVPSVALRDVRVLDPDGRPALQVPRVLAAFSVLSLGTLGLEQLVIDAPELELRRTRDGRLLAGGIDLSGDATGDTRAADWFFSQDEIIVRDGRVRWVDEQRAAPPVQLSAVLFVSRNGYGRHQLRLDATPEPAWGERFTLIGQFRQRVFSRHPGYWREWDGQAFASAPRIDVSRLRQYVDLTADWGVDVQAGHGALRLWLEQKQGRPVAATADLALGAVSVTLGPRLAPLAFSELTGRLAWRDPGDGMTLGTRDLRFVDADGLTWPGGNLRLALHDAAGRHPSGGEFSGDRLDLAALAKIAQRLPLPSAVHERLQAHPVQGLVERIEARWQGPLEAPTDWRVQTRVSGLALAAPAQATPATGEPVAGIPGIEGAALELEATPAGGRASLAIADGALTFPGVFEEPRIPLARLDLRGRWRVQGEQLAVEVEQLDLRNADATGSFKARWQTLAGAQGAARFPGLLDLSGSFSRANGARVHRYLPLVIPAEARHYVRDAIVRGDARDVAVRVRGDLRQLPFDQHPEAGEFRFAGPVQGVTMAYVPRALQPAGQPPWPALEGLAGELIFERNSMRVRQASARVQGHPGWRFTRVQADIDDLQHARVRVEAEGRGVLASALDIVRGSPVAGFIEHALDRASASGDASLQLRLDLPIDAIDRSRVNGRVALAGNELRIAPEAPLLTQAQGVVTFSETGFAVADARVQLLGGQARLSGGSTAAAPGGPTVLLRASGSASAEGLREMADWAPLPALARQATGSASYEAQIGFRGGEPEVRVTSDLRGLAFDLPAPLDKPADAAWPLRYDSGPVAGSAGRQRLRVELAQRLAIEYEHAADSDRVLRGLIGLGPRATALALPASGVQAGIELPHLDVERWRDALQRVLGGGATLSAEGGRLPSQWTLRTAELVVDGRSLNDVVASGTQQGGQWRGEVQARELAGRIDFREGADGRAGKLSARLARLSIPAGGSDDRTLLAQPPAQIPALDVVVEQFELRGKALGRLEIQAVNHDVAGPAAAGETLQNWELSRLSLQAPEAHLTAHGRWAALARGPGLPLDPRGPRAPEDRRRTQLEFKLDIRDAGKLLARLDMPDVLARGRGELRGGLGWRGTPFSPHYPSMAGQLHLDVDAGQFLKADPGVAKLLGVLSLQALPRRLTLDFRDLFSTGFAFDFIRGDVEVQAGIARTNNLQMKGPSAAVLMDGEADLDHETQRLRVLVVPEIDAGTAALVATAINPAIGIGAFVAQLVLKRPLIKAATREFQISGRWDDPQVTPLGAPAADAQTPAPATPPTPRSATDTPEEERS